MDLLRAWIISAAVCLAINFALSITVGYSMHLLYALCPMLAGTAASLYHAERAIGGWVRHFVAVLPVPMLLNAYWAVLQQIPSTAEQWGVLGLAIVQAGALAAVGLGLVMLTRWLLSYKVDSHATY